jgi:predicted amidohydrolase
MSESKKLTPHNLKVTIIQTHLFWEDSEKNLKHLDDKLNSLGVETDIIVLPEMFTTGFTMNPKVLAENHGGIGLQWMIKKAIEKNCVLVGSIAVTENNLFYNRLYWVMPDGKYEFYNKRHLFAMGNEHEHYTAGKSKLIIHYKGWKICPLICYDLRFPVWSRNKSNDAYDVLIYVANWPEVRSYVWQHLLISRAIENQAFVIGVNRIGSDGNNMAHSGNSVVLNPKGELLLNTLPHQEVTDSINLSYSYIQEFRKLFPVLLDADEFNLNGFT